MLPEQVDAMLKNYKAYAGRCAHLELELSLCENRIAQLHESVRIVNSASVENEAYHVQQYENMDMPRGTAISKPTEQLAIKYANRYTADAPYIISAQDDIDAMKAELAHKMITVRFVETWLSALNEKDRWLVMEQVIEGKTWRQLCVEYRRFVGEYASKDTLRRIKARVLCRIYEIAQ